MTQLQAATLAPLRVLVSCTVVLPSNIQADPGNMTNTCVAYLTKTRGKVKVGTVKLILQTS